MNSSLLLLLILLNGLFSMSEMSVVASSKARLQKLIARKRPGARTALTLHEEPTRFLSTVQVGITAVGILTGVLGEEVLKTPLRQLIVQNPSLAPYAETIALISTVMLITYVSVVVGELFPKSLALQNPETIATVVAKPMQTLAYLVSPLVWLLSATNHLLLKLLRLHQPQETMVSDEEIQILMEMGSESGVFHASESQLVTNVMKLDELRVGAIMVPRQDIYMLDPQEDADTIREKIQECPYSRIVVCRGGFENVLGILHCGDLLKATLRDTKLDIERDLKSPLYIQDSMSITHLLNHFREARSDLALIVNEYGDIEGLVTLMDVFTAIIGNLPHNLPMSSLGAVQRADGSWLVDGSLSIAQFKASTGIKEQLPGESANAYHTMAGMILFNLERLPRVADTYATQNWKFEVVDLDGTRIDKILVTAIAPEHENAKSKHRD